jgi:hypothetical protein
MPFAVALFYFIFLQKKFSMKSQTFVDLLMETSWKKLFSVFGVGMFIFFPRKLPLGV